MSRDAPRRGPGRIVLRILLLAAVLGAIVALVDVTQVLRRIAGLPPIAAIVALALALASRGAMGFKWRHLLRAAGSNIPLRRTVSAYFQSAFSVRVVPVGLGGDLLRAWLVRRDGIPGGTLVASMVLEKAIGLLSVVVVAGLGATWLALGSGIRVPPILGWLVAAAAVTALAAILLLWLPSAHARAATVLQWLPEKLRRLGERASAAVLAYRSVPRALLVNLGLAVGEQGLQLLRLVVIAVGLGIVLPLADLLAALAVVLLARRAAGYVEGLGLAEGVSMLALALFGVEAEAAVALFVTNYAISTAAALPGAVLLWRSRGDLAAWRAGTGPPSSPGSAGSVDGTASGEGPSEAGAGLGIPWREPSSGSLRP